MWQWCVDPLDGTLNYLRGIDLWVVSIGVLYAGKPVVGVVHRPPTGQLWAAATDHPRPHSTEISQAARLSEAVAAVRLDDQHRLLRRASNAIGSQRHVGSAALQLAWLADGRLDLVVYGYEKLGPWDVAAGRVLCAAAGLSVRSSSAWNSPATWFVAGRPHLVEELCRLTET